VTDSPLCIRNVLVSKIRRAIAIDRNGKSLSAGVEKLGAEIFFWAFVESLLAGTNEKTSRLPCRQLDYRTSTDLVQMELTAEDERRRQRRGSCKRSDIRGPVTRPPALSTARIHSLWLHRRILSKVG
jgi:hypothetical protein